MTKTSAVTTRSPLEFASCQDVTYEKLRDIARAQNWGLTHRNTCHFSLTVGGDGWDSYPVASDGQAAGTAQAIATLGITANATLIQPVETSIILNADVAQLGDVEFGVECAVPPGNTVRVSCRLVGSLGTGVIDVDCTNADNNSEVVVPLGGLTGVTPGGEWVSVFITVQRIAGTDTDIPVRTVRLEETVIADIVLPDPLND